LKLSSPISANASTTNSNGKRKQHPNGAIASKEKKLNSGPTPPGRISSTISAAPDQESGVITKEQVVTLLRIRPLTTKELLAHFKQRLKEASNKAIIFAIIREVANINEGLLILKDSV
jgi:hypothetical protein